MPNWKKLIVSGSDASLSTLTITNSGSLDDSLLLTATEDSSTAAPVATFKRNSSSPADADYLGQLKFKGENDADQEVVYAKITAKIQDASDGSEDGLIEFANRRGGLNVITARFNSEKLQLLNGTDLEVDGTVSATNIGFHTESISNVTSVNIDHNLNEDYPIVQVYDSNKNQMLPATVTSTSANRVVLTFDSAFTGQVSVKK
jgi:hypothetical protein